MQCFIHAHQLTDLTEAWLTGLEESATFEVINAAPEDDRLFSLGASSYRLFFLLGLLPFSPHILHLNLYQV